MSWAVRRMLVISVLGFALAGCSSDESVPDPADQGPAGPTQREEFSAAKDRCRDHRSSSKQARRNPEAFAEQIASVAKDEFQASVRDGCLAGLRP